jgi:hypothetical protein
MSNVRSDQFRVSLSRTCWITLVPTKVFCWVRFSVIEFSRHWALGFCCGFKFARTRLYVHAQVFDLSLSFSLPVQPNSSRFVYSTCHRDSLPWYQLDSSSPLRPSIALFATKNSPWFTHHVQSKFGPTWHIALINTPYYNGKRDGD